MKVAALQMVSGVAPEDNFAQARALIAQAARAGAELLVLPEYFAAMGMRDTDKLALAETPGDGPIQRWLAQSAREHGVWLVGGTLALRGSEPGRVRNSSLVFDPQGRQVARYDKVHLFVLDRAAEQFDEARTIAPGSAPVRFALTARDGSRWRVGLSVCYDLRFPELYRAHAAGGCELLLVPSAFTWTTGRAHWELLLRARAIENQAYVLAAAQGGQHQNGRRTWGHSMVVDPWGEVLAQHAEGPAVVVAELDAARLAQVRGQLPALRHRVL
ncbi:carbon-nitrogen hydrolase family protein [Comamonas sp. NLF-1-9]|uniref:carbon-nitrogen hydrolase family protein n=1 Tax=Comamonas sp. NLF-1-9 TaxID=2853163 RepID=UPI001C47D112|nr:carbon-nitrogen hydrolase family protein [Comamonas sp. NLF-1-9]QXL84056.1 carbon-nitrogen hydrolase family protein [Comamonas sp. NLF-1-9]